MTTIETILTGIIVCLLSVFLGKLWGERGKVTEALCDRKQLACSTIICVKIDVLTKSQEEVKQDIKEIKDRLFELCSEGGLRS